jgi:hypothetical protein
MQVEITLYGGDGNVLGDLEAMLGPREYRQIDNVLAPFTGEDVVNGHAILTTSSTSCGYFAYASVVDNRSGDPIFIPAMKTP